ncbi:unnamed protein product [Rotaria magnacalcarata]|uniref:Uncharacterized protein n=1 Tax=Rotaria magnacalcarata TaxID=392030 RepID=A0A819VN97_9BILA|nr:unnamed protein product [Rotaria magnacalcarata]
MNTSLNSQLLVASLVNVMELIKVSQDTFLNMKIASAFRQVYNEVTNFSGTQYLHRVVQLIKSEIEVGENPHAKLLYKCADGNTHKALNVYMDDKDFIIDCECKDDNGEPIAITEECCKTCACTNNATVIAAVIDQFKEIHGRKSLNANKDNGRCKKTERLIERVIDKVLANNVVYEAKIRVPYYMYMFLFFLFPQRERLRNLSRDKSQPSTSGTQIKRTSQAPVDVDEIVPEVGTSMSDAKTSMRYRLPACECGSINHRADSTIAPEARPVNDGDTRTDQNAYIVDLSD